MAKTKVKSRATRWNEAHQKAESLRDVVRDEMDKLGEALGELRDIQGEFQEWRDNLPENLDGSPVAEKLDAVLGLDLDGVADDPGADWQATDQVIEECGAVDLPLGFGRD